MKKLLDWPIKACSILSAIAMIAMLLLINVDVIGRYLFNSPVIGAMDVSVFYLMVAIVFLPLAMAEKGNHHITVELMTQFFNKKTMRWVSLFTVLLSAAYFFALAWWGGIEAIEKYQVGEYVMGELGLTVWPGRFFVPIGCGVIALVFLYKAWRLIIGDQTVMDDEHELDEGDYHE